MFAMSGFEFSDTTLEGFMQMADVNGDGIIDYEEAIPFIRAIIADSAFAAPPPMPKASEVPVDMMDHYLSQMFSIADTNGDGVLQKEELSQVCGWIRELSHKYGGNREVGLIMLLQMFALSGFDLDELVVENLIRVADSNGERYMDRVYIRLNPFVTICGIVYTSVSFTITLLVCAIHYHSISSLYVRLRLCLSTLRR